MRRLYLGIPVLLVTIVVAALSGCDTVMCNLGNCGPLLDEAQVGWDGWLGKSKDDRIKSIGLPASCTTLTSGEEMCEWRDGGVSGGGSYNPNFGGSSSVSSYEHKRIFIYDKNHIAVGWSYQGSWGTRSSRRIQAVP